PLLGTSRAFISNGLTLQQGIVLISDGAFLDFQGTQTLLGTGEVAFTMSHDQSNDVNSVFVDDGSTLTIGPGITIHGIAGFIGGAGLGTGQILNQGTIRSDGGDTVTVRGINNFSAGTLAGGSWQVSGNSILQLNGANVTTNAASILVDGAGAQLLSA